MYCEAVMAMASVGEAGAASTSENDGSTLEKVIKDRLPIWVPTPRLSQDPELQLCLAPSCLTHAPPYLSLKCNCPRHLDQVMKSNALKVILLGDAAAGKSKLIERFLLEGYVPHRLSTYAVTIYNHVWKKEDGSEVPVVFWDTAGQEKFNKLHPSYYYQAHACILVFDVTRKLTYKNLERWYQELQEYCEGIPTFVVANKIDIDYKVGLLKEFFFFRNWETRG